MAFSPAYMEEGKKGGNEGKGKYNTWKNEMLKGRKGEK